MKDRWRHLRSYLRPDDVFGAMVLAFAAFQVLLQASHLGRGFEYVVTRVMVDDAFYYLQPALNLWRHGFVTFDGIHPTNGFQMLWFLIVCPLPGLVDDPMALAMVVLALCVVFNGLTHWVLLKIGREVGSPTAGLFLSGLWFSLNVATNTYWTGMENAIHALIFCLSLLVFLRFSNARLEGRASSPLPLAFLLALNAWCRLDAAVFSIVMFGAAAVVAWLTGRQFNRAFWRIGAPFLVAGCVAAIGAAWLLELFRWMGGSWLPVSALIKSAAPAPDSASQFGEEVLLTLSQGFPETGVLIVREPLATIAGLTALLVLACFLVLDWFASRPVRATGPLEGNSRSRFQAGMAGLRSVLILSCGTVVLYAVVAGSLRPSTYGALVVVALVIDGVFLRSEGPSKSFRFAIVGLSLGLVSHACIFVGAGLRAPMLSTWYRAPCNLVWVLVFAFVADVVCRLFPSSAVALRGSVVAMVGVLAVGGLVKFSEGLPSSSIYQARYTAARWISENLEPDAILGSWNSGQIGYLSDRPVVNLDGLMNSAEYFHELQQPDFEIAEYLAANRVGYLVDYSLPEELRQSVETIQVFPTQDGWRPVVVYRFSPGSVAAKGPLQ
ncbi:MAG: hypothetical protein ABFS37_14565 [Acidobacteriota bacterium]